MNRLCNRLRSILGGEALVVFLFILTSCGETIDVVQPDGTVTRDITVQVLPMQSIDNAATRAAVDKPEEGEALTVTFGNAAAATRADLAMTAAEKVINKAYVVQFNGIAPTSTAVWVSEDVSAQLKSNSPINCNFTLPDSKIRLYVIANPSAKPAVGMTLSAFETVAYTISSSLPTTGLPLAAGQDVSASEGIHLFQLKCPLVRLTVTASKGTSILKGIPSAYSLAPATPGDNPVRPSDITYDGTVTLTSGTTYYVPANLSGRVDMAEPIYRCSLVAPTNSMYVVISANSTTYNVYLGDGTASDFNVVSNYAYNVDATISGTDDNDLRVGSPTNLALDAKGTANCYIAPCANMPCSFNATVMGNGRTTPAHTAGSAGGGNYPAILPTTLTPTSAEVLWETVNTTSAPAGGSVVRDVALANGRVTFRSGTAQGNAVIAVKNSSGTILWSWHIWRLNETPKEIGLAAIAPLTVDNELVIIDRNLGALSAAAGSDLSTGMHYQWGRKDPMPGATLAGTAMATQPAGIPNLPDTYAQYTVAQSIQQPSTFLRCISDWCTPRTDNLWGTPLTEKLTISNGEDNVINTNSGMKSIYDPCPVGWRVPPDYAFANTVKPTTAWDKGWNLTGFGGASSYFPASGDRACSNGMFYSVGSYGSYWMSTPNANDPTNGSFLNFSIGIVIPASYNYQGHGFSCRCAKE